MNKIKSKIPMKERHKHDLMFNDKQLEIEKQIEKDIVKRVNRDIFVLLLVLFAGMVLFLLTNK